MREVARESVQETLISLGMTPEEPRAMQADLLYLRTLRKGSEFLSLRIKIAMVALIVPSILYAIWETIKQSFVK